MGVAGGQGRCSRSSKPSPTRSPSRWRSGSSPGACLTHSPPGESFRVVAVSDEDGQLEVDHDDTGVAVYGWPGCTIRVYSEDDLIDDFSTKFPAFRAGMSTKSFIGFLFGGPGGPVR